MASATSKPLPSLPNGPQVRSLPIGQWPFADRDAWAAACRPNQRLIRGGAGAHMKPITLTDLARRYGYFLDFLDRSGLLDRNAAAASQVTPENVIGYVEELGERVSSVTTYGSVYKLRRASQLLDPRGDFGWLTEIEKDLTLLMRPRSKAERLVLTEVLLEAGLTLMAEADGSTTLSQLATARLFREGLMIATLALHPIRLKNFASLTIGGNLITVNSAWWITLSAAETKENRPDERRIDEAIVPGLTCYLDKHRPVLSRNVEGSNALWLSANDGRPMTYNAIGAVIARTTLVALGVGVGSHMFRTAGASSAAIHASGNPNLGSALLHHRDRRVTEEHYNRASSLTAANDFARLIRQTIE